MSRHPVEQSDIRRISGIIAESLRPPQEAALVRKDPGLSSACIRDAADAVDDARICNKRDDAHATATGIQEGIRFKDFLNQANPCVAGFPVNI
jgi:hypothetical protein